MFNELLNHIEEQLTKGSDFAVVQVIDRVAPSSGKIGDKALVLETGELIGWVGGGCVRGIVIKEALEVIRTRRYRRVRISPEGGTRETANYKEYVMTCQSKGTVEILIEPMITQPELIVIGKSNIARKLVSLAEASDFRVSLMASDADPQNFPAAHTIYNKVDFGSIQVHGNTYIIVTTRGENDDQAVAKALETKSPFVGFLASNKKAEDLKAKLLESGITRQTLERLKSPVGLDINAKLASEVAISILAEVIGHFRSNRTDDVRGEAAKKEADEDLAPAPESTEKAKSNAFEEEYYINPVCQVPVSRKNPKHIIEYKGERVYFCCDGCKVSFENNPAQYIK